MILSIYLILIKHSNGSNEEIKLLARGYLKEARHYLLNNGLRVCRRKISKRICDEAVIIELIEEFNVKSIKKRKKTDPNVKKGCWKWNILADMLSPNSTQQSFYFDENATDCFDKYFQNSNK